jgi:hypothetical protein
LSYFLNDLNSYPSLSATDLANAWAYAAAFPEEIELEIHENNEGKLIRGVSPAQD